MNYNYLIILPLFILAPLILFGKTAKQISANIDIPYKKYKLDNGLTLIVHEDNKAPIVAVNVWYHVGSKNEKQGKTGFAHLFEHLMFNGSENFNDDYFQALERIGATNMNGTTSNDRTNYFQNVPSNALDVVLWMESDRMGHLLGAIDQAKLDEQRGVVQNEKRQYENQPYSIADELITKSTWPANHPYSWQVIGSMEDLNAATIKDVHDWFKNYYGAANAVIVIAGNIKSESVFESVKKYFGDIQSGPPISRQQVWIAKRSTTQRQYAQDRVPQARLYKVWNVPQYGSKEAVYLDLLSDILSSGKTSRLYKRLVYNEQIATRANSYIDAMEIASQFYIDVTAKPNGDIEKIEKIVNEELNKIFKNGITEKELQRVKTQYIASFVRGIERIGGFGGKSDILARGFIYNNNPEYYKTILNYVQTATVADIKSIATKWLSEGDYNLIIHPFGNYTTTPTDSVLRKNIPTPKDFESVSFPQIQTTTLSNGLKILFAQRKSVPIVNMQLIFDAGFATDIFYLPGVANLAMNMLDEGTKTRSAMQISEELDMLGTNLSTSSNLDMSIISLNSLTQNLDKSLDVMADIILNPTFPAEDFNRLKQQTIAAIQREKVEPFSMGLRTLPKLLFGSGHGYSNPLTGTGTEESVQKISRNDMVKFHNEWIKPNNATLIVVGDITLEEIKVKFEKLFASWQKGSIKIKNISPVEPPKKSIIYLMDKPDAEQSLIFAAQFAPNKNSNDDIAFDALNAILGGSFTSRINMNIREDKHWSYGARTAIVGARSQRPYIAYTSVQQDKTKETIVEIKKEFSDIIENKPITLDELSKVKNNLTLQLPGKWETMGAVLSSIADIINYNLPLNYYDTYSEKILNLNQNNLNQTAKTHLTPHNLIWVVIGDRKKIEECIKSLNLGEIKFIDTDGNVIK